MLKLIPPEQAGGGGIMVTMYGMFVVSLRLVPPIPWENPDPNGYQRDLIEVAIGFGIPLLAIAGAMLSFRALTKAESLRIDASHIRWREAPGGEAAHALSDIGGVSTTGLSDEDKGRLLIRLASGKTVKFHEKLMPGMKETIRAIKQFIPGQEKLRPGIRVPETVPIAVAHEPGVKHARAALAMAGLRLALLLVGIAYAGLSGLLNGWHGVELPLGTRVGLGLGFACGTAILAVEAAVSITGLRQRLRQRAGEVVVFGRRGLCVLRAGCRRHVPWSSVVSVNTQSGKLSCADPKAAADVILMSTPLEREQAQALMTHFMPKGQVAPQFAAYLHDAYRDSAHGFGLRLFVLLAVYFFVLYQRSAWPEFALLFGASMVVVGVFYSLGFRQQHRWKPV